MKRAIEDGKIEVKFYNPRDFAENGQTKTAKSGSSVEQSWLRKRIDRAPYGGGPGMVIQALPVIKSIESALISKGKSKKLKEKNTKTKIIWLSPSGKQFTNDYAKKTAKKYENVVIICGRYEGIDARVKKAFKVEEISVGPFVLTGGELPAMTLIDVISRQVRGVLGDFNSLEESRISSPDVYTRPEIFEYKKKKYRVPKVLLSGNQKKIEEWKKIKNGTRSQNTIILSHK